MSSAESQHINVLLVEDNPTDYHLTAKMFGTLNDHYSVNLDWCQSYEEAFDVIWRREHNVYIIDYSLGEKSGLDLVEESLSKSNAAGPFVLLSDYEASALFDRSAELGIYDHILKRELSPSVLERTMTYSVQRYKTEQDLKREQEFNAFILAEMPYLILSIDKAGLVATVNNAVCDLLGQTEEELRHTPWKSILHPEDAKDIKYKSNDSGEVFFEARVQSKTLGDRIINWNILNRGSGQNNIGETAFILSGKDATDLLNAQDNERHRQKMEALGQLAGGVAHEMNNLLQPILMSSQMVRSKVEAAENIDNNIVEYCLKNMSRIQRNAQSAAKIVDDILLFSRGEQKEKECLNLYDVIENSICFVSDILPATVQVVSDLNPSGKDIKANINQNEMIQIITNLLINAGHAMGGQGDIHIHAQPKRVDGELANQIKLVPGTYMNVKIIDKGHGISQEDISKIFNPFFTTKDVGEGTGLGLSIVYKIIEEWGGTIKVDSKLGEGTTFSIFIPVS